LIDVVETRSGIKLQLEVVRFIIARQRSSPMPRWNANSNNQRHTEDVRDEEWRSTSITLIQHYRNCVFFNNYHASDISDVALKMLQL
jgi:hypothetical protein